MIVYLVPAAVAGATTGLADNAGAVGDEGGLIEGVVDVAGAGGMLFAVRSGGRILGDAPVVEAVPGIGGAITGASEFGTLLAAAVPVPVVPSAVAVGFVPLAAPPMTGLPAPGDVMLAPVLGFANAVSGGVAAPPEGADVEAGPIVRVCGTDAPGAIGSLMRPVADSVLPGSASRDTVVRDFAGLKA